MTRIPMIPYPVPAIASTFASPQASWMAWLTRNRGLVTARRATFGQQALTILELDRDGSFCDCAAQLGRERQVAAAQPVGEPNLAVSSLRLRIPSFVKTTFKWSCTV